MANNALIVTPRNINRAYLIKAATDNMAADITSNICDFKEMAIGSIEAYWDGNDQTDGTIEVRGTNVKERPIDRWASLCGSEVDLDTPRKCRLFNLGVLGYRYAVVLYKKGTVTTGSLEVIALAKISK